MKLAFDAQYKTVILSLLAYIVALVFALKITGFALTLKMLALNPSL